jgi:DNA-directed RNA polymerase subunit RPC12/RpoP
METSLVLLAMFMGLPGILAAGLVLAFVFFAWSPRPARAAEKTPAPVTVQAVKSLTRAEIQQKLQKLAETPPPNLQQVTASCYARTAPPSRAEYVCPKCGEKTLYANTNKGAEVVSFSLEGARDRARKKIGGCSLALDESQFCRKCSPEIKEPKLIFKMEYVCAECGGKNAVCLPVQSIVLRLGRLQRAMVNPEIATSERLERGAG